MFKEQLIVKFTDEQLAEAQRIMINMLTKVVEVGGSDLFISAE